MDGAYDRAGMKTAYGWLVLSVASLVFAGVFAFLVALARTPVIEDMLPLGTDYLYAALVGHVVLAVVIWFLAFEGFLWAWSSTVLMKKRQLLPSLGRPSVFVSASGMALVVISAAFGYGQAELANYVPVLLTPVFFAGLVLFSSGAVINLVNTSGSVFAGKRAVLVDAVFGLLVAGASVLSALACIGLSWWSQYSTGKVFLDFERLFWGGGHVLQFANTISMTAVWLILYRTAFDEDAMPPFISKALYCVFFLFILASPVIYFIYDTSAQAHKESFTWLMRWGLGPPAAVFTLAVGWKVITRRGQWKDPGYSSLALSVGVFSIGGLIGASIDGVNTIIPAHYHCAIGAVTIAFMGFFYKALPSFNRSLWSRKLASVQPYLYSAGVVLFAAGLYVAGMDGAARKTYGGGQDLGSAARLIGMSVMGAGGLVAITGGAAFVLNAVLSLFRRVHGSPGEG